MDSGEVRFQPLFFSERMVVAKKVSSAAKLNDSDQASQCSI